MKMSNEAIEMKHAAVEGKRDQGRLGHARSRPIRHRFKQSRDLYRSYLTRRFQWCAHIDLVQLVGGDNSHKSPKSPPLDASLQRFLCELSPLVEQFRPI